jgi:hypothetical protein
MTPSDVFVASALRFRGTVAEKGAVVLRPGYFVFAPHESASGAFVGCGANVLPPAFASVAAYVRYLSTLGEGDFDATVDDAVRQCGWLRIDRGSARVRKKRAFFRRHKVTVSFETESDTVRIDAPIDPLRLADVERMLVAWNP